MADKVYFVQCGNWCLKFYANLKQYNDKQYGYTELATKAIEVVFGEAEFVNEADDYYTMMNESGKNVLDDDDAEIPIPTFTVKMYVLDSKSGHPNKILTTLRTADIFANAAQPENQALALKAEND